MSESTSIMDLPTEPIGNKNNGSNNITLKMTEQVQGQSQGQEGLTLDQTTINQIVNGLQQASISGATLLPSRDISMSTTGLSADPQVQPNYLPPPPQNSSNNDYIRDSLDPDDIIDKYNKNTQRQNSLDDMYNEMQTPLLLAVLYFLFQLPFFRKLLFSYFPILFSNDGNLNINGFLFTSILFGLAFYLFNKLTNQFGTF